MLRQMKSVETQFFSTQEVPAELISQVPSQG